LTDNGVVLHAGHELINQAEHLVHLFSDEEKVSYKEEYGDLALTVECVDDIYNAVLHINTYGRFLIFVIFCNYSKTIPFKAKSLLFRSDC